MSVLLSPMLWTIVLLFTFGANCNASRHKDHHHYPGKIDFRQTSNNTQDNNTHGNSSHNPVSFIQSTSGASTAGFAVLPPGTVANSSIVNLTTQCINAMESTVQCDDNLNTIAAADYYLQVDTADFQSICTTACSTSLTTYHQNVSSACAGQPEAWSGYPATYFGDVLWASWNLTCLSDPKTGQSCMCKRILASEDRESRKRADPYTSLFFQHLEQLHIRHIGHNAATRCSLLSVRAVHVSDVSTDSIQQLRH